MGRHTKGYKVYWKRGWAYVRFTWDGNLLRFALHTKDRRVAEEAAARTHAEVVDGRRRPIQQQPGKPLDLVQLLSEWTESKRTSVDVDFFPTLNGYASVYVDYFKSFERITDATASSFGLYRLGCVLRTTVLRELSYLRQFLAWAKLHKALARVPVVATLPPKAKGVRAGPQRAKPVQITPADAAEILSRLPELSKTIGGRKWPLRAEFEFMWETALRPETLHRLSVPENWQPGMKHLILDDEDDKARFGREVDLTQEAVAILTRVAPKEGLIFGSHCYTKVLKKVAKAVLGQAKGKSFAPYDFRHTRAKERLDAGAPLRGVAYMLGHKRMSTTDKYLAPDRAAGRAALLDDAAKKK